MTYKPSKVDTYAFKRERRAEYDFVMKEYAPIFDKWVALDMYINNIDPPTCSVCKKRLQVNKRMNTTCSDCQYAASRYTYEKFSNEFEGDKLSIPEWEGIKKTSEKVPRVCEQHGDYTQALSSALKGHGCFKCRAWDTPTGSDEYRDKLFEELKNIHRGEYVYHPDSYVKLDEKMTITCKKHDIEFEQIARLHRDGRTGCSKCLGKYHLPVMPRDEMISKANNKHNNFYDYEKTFPNGSKSKVVITCPKHGDFEQVVGYHLNCGNGCQKCGLEKAGFHGARSKPEIEVEDFIRTLGQHNIESNDFVVTSEIDILVDRKVGVEFNGLYWHSSFSKSTDAKISKKHLQKTRVCEANDIQLFHIFENEWNEKKDIWKSMLSSSLGVSERVYARKCNIVKMTSGEARSFFDANHMQGHVNSSIYYGLVHNGKVVCGISIGKPRFTEADFEIYRYCNILNTTIVGGFSKLMKHITSVEGHKGVYISYANRRWSRGGLYEACGFERVKDSTPNYFYWKSGNKLETRNKYQKHKLHTLLENFDPNLSEVENMYGHGYGRIWDCGNIIYRKTYE